MSSSSSPAPTPSAGQSAPAANAKQKANQIGHSFITTYYHTLSENTNTCFKFYKNNSQLSHEPDVTYNNSNDIKEYYFSGCKFAGALINLEHGNFDIQPSFGGGVLICITGHMTLKENTDCKKSFVHTFFLGCENVNVAGGATKQRYYVLNEVLRFVEAPTVVPLPVQDVDDDVIDVHATEDDNVVAVAVNVVEETDSKHNGGSNMVIQRGEEETKDEILVSDEAKLVEEMTNLTTEPFAATTDPAVGDLDEKTTSVNDNDPVVAMETVSAVESAQLEELSAVEQVALSNTPMAAVNLNAVTAVQAEPSKPKSWAALLSSSPARSSSSSAANVAASSSSSNAKLFRKMKPVDGSATDVKASLAEGITESSQKEVMNKEAAVEATTVVPGTGGRTATTTMSSGDRNFGACSLYVSNVNRDVSEKGLRELFGKYGFRIVNVTVAQTRGFGFIDFSDPNAADVILKQGGNTYTLNGRQITVEKKDIGRARGGRSGKNGSSRRSSPRGAGGGHKSRSSRGGKNKGGSHSGGNKQGQSVASAGNGGSGGGES
eukprot:CAMPEP_0196804706 /NCGR_PEP_ID=MMETSP1362-20130617/4373_1 /TAXON_ID=163516 /ORGANISM="Leptocylindrus danicus, Strain CCMP1856" /LENGTH=546 /DNA_ID=CAMNT_0042177175 /DNA_START=193 /DNA_END=1833 /DNA_ORIENTATION=-